VLALLCLLVVKVEFKNPDSNDAFYAYGVGVTAVVFITMAVSFGFYKDPALMAQAAMEDTSLTSMFRDNYPLVSCVVAVHNEKALVNRCIASMVNQTYPNLEIIVIDDASTDGTTHVLRQLASEYNIGLIELAQNRGKKRALAAGLQRARGSIVAFADSDTVWALDAVARAVPIFVTNEDVGAVSGHCRALNSGDTLLTKIQDSWYEGQFSVRKAFESVFGAVTCVSGPLAFFRMAAIYNYMPAWAADTFLGQEFRFATDRTLTAYVLGGSYLGPKILPRHAGSAFATPSYPVRDWNILYSKSTRAWTNVPETLRAVIKQQVRWKKSFIRNIFVTGRFYWRRPLLPALFYYIHVIFVLLGPFIAARHLLYLPLRGNPMSLVLYLAGISIIGLAFGLAFRHESPGTRLWMYRPLMSLMSTLIFSWLIFYSAVTIKKMTWFRG
jgi:cellulose synthase/poly-beta-1,6-N-acetylglucosamine synthase-like glycosyltransferase